VEFPSRRLDRELDEGTCGGAFIGSWGAIGLTRIFGIGRIAGVETGCEVDSAGCDAVAEGAKGAGAEGRGPGALGDSSVVATFEPRPAGRLLGEPLPAATVESNSRLVCLSPGTDMFACFCWYSCIAAGPQCVEFV